MTTCWLVKDPVAIDNPLVLESIPWWYVAIFLGAYLHMRFLFILISILIPDESVKRPHFLLVLGVVSIHFFAE
jgi:hypothetical protein